MHRNPFQSTATLFIIGMGLILANMVFLAEKMNEATAERYAADYILALNQFQAQYSSKVVARLKDRGIEARSDYNDHEGTIPIPATLGIEMADALTNPETGIRILIYSDFPFKSRKDGGPRDEFESLALTKFRFAIDKEKPFISYENVAGRYSLRYARAMIMEESCVACHNAHPESTKTDWKVGQVRGVRALTFPIGAAGSGSHKGWNVTLTVMLTMTVAGLGILFLVIRALHSSIELLSKSNAALIGLFLTSFSSISTKRTLLMFS